MRIVSSYRLHWKNGISVSINVILNGFILILLPLIAIFRVVIRIHPHYRRRSIWTGAPIITMPLNAQVERRLGFDTKTIVRSTYFITDQFDLNIFTFTRQNRLLTRLVTYVVFIWICLTTQRVHAYVDGGLLISSQPFCFNRLELFFYKILKIKLFVWTYGADVRAKQMTLKLGNSNCCIDCTTPRLSCVCDDRLAIQNYARVFNVAKAVFSMGDMIEYAPKSKTNLFFWPIDLDKNNGERYRASYPHGSTLKPLRIVHAPNHRAFKGTRYLEAAVKELIDEGIAIDLILVERMPNEAALAIYNSADLIFDQCLIGFHGYFAIEAMALGKPVMCYIRYPEQYLLNHEQCPIINVPREGLKNALRRFATSDRKLLPDIGRQSRIYVEQHYTLDAFSDRLKKCYEELGVTA